MAHIATAAFFLFTAASIAIAGPPISIPKDPIRVPGATTPIQKEEEEEKAVAPLDIQIERSALVIDLGPLPKEEKQQDTQGYATRLMRIGSSRDTHHPPFGITAADRPHPLYLVVSLVRRGAT